MPALRTIFLTFSPSLAASPTLLANFYHNWYPSGQPIESEQTHLNTFFIRDITLFNDASLWRCAMRFQLEKPISLRYIPDPCDDVVAIL
jgi:hypothetical protein